MDLRTLHRQHVPRKHHLVLPAIQAADAPVRTHVDAKTRAVALAPNRAFMEGGLQLTVLTDDLALATHKDKRAVDGALRALIQLGDANRDIDLPLARRRAYPGYLRPRNFHSSRKIRGTRPPAHWSR